MTAADIGPIISDLTNFIIAVSALLVAWRSHQVINTQVKPEQAAQAATQQAQAVTQQAQGIAQQETARAVRQIVNGGPPGEH